MPCFPVVGRASLVFQFGRRVRGGLGWAPLDQIVDCSGALGQLEVSHPGGNAKLRHKIDVWLSSPAQGRP
eukprot:6289228-Pyramimonas_sp.AAC.1